MISTWKYHLIIFCFVGWIQIWCFQILQFAVCILQVLQVSPLYTFLVLQALHCHHHWKLKEEEVISILTLVTTTAKICTGHTVLFAVASAFTAVTIKAARYQLDKSLWSNIFVKAHLHQNSISFHLPTMKKVINSHNYR